MISGARGVSTNRRSCRFSGDDSLSFNSETFITKLSMMSVKAAFELFQFYLEAEMASLLVKMEADGTESNKKSPCRWNERDD